VQLNGDTTRYTPKSSAWRDTDLAVIKIDASRNCPSEAREIRMAQWATGCWRSAVPSDCKRQSCGIISAKDRGGIGHQFQRFLQTDAGSTGEFWRATVDLAGEVIGINSRSSRAAAAMKASASPCPDHGDQRLRPDYQQGPRGPLLGGRVAASASEEAQISIPLNSASRLPNRWAERAPVIVA